MTETALYATLAGLFGLLIGSFLNVCIYRLDQGICRSVKSTLELRHPGERIDYRVRTTSQFSASVLLTGQAARHSPGSHRVDFTPLSGN